MWLSIHAAFTEEGGGEVRVGWGWGGAGETGVSEGERWSFFLSLLAQREGKTIGVQMDASPLFLDDLPLPSLRPNVLGTDGGTSWRRGGAV